jgi:hypothetical protein
MSLSIYDLLFVVIVVIGALIRIVPLLKLRLESGDNYYHLLAARQIRREKKLPSELGYFIFKGTYSYPPLLHLILASIQKPQHYDNRTRSALLVSPIIDVLSCIFLYYSVSLIIDPAIALLSALIYMSTPILVFESLPITPRPLGLLFLNAYLLCLYGFSSYHALELLIPASFCVTGALLGHKMATQSLFFVGIFLSLVFVALDYSISEFVVISILSGLILALIISKGFYKKVFRGHKAMLGYHFKHGNYKGEKRFGNAIEIIQRWPWIFLLPIAFFIGNTQSLQASENLVLLLWGLFFITITMLWRYGDNYRYLVYGVAPLSIVLAQLLWASPELQRNILLTALVAGNALRIIVFFRRRSKESLVSQSLRKCFDFLRRQDNFSIGCVPVSLNYPTAYFTEKKVLGSEASPESWETGIDLSGFFKDESLLLNLMKAHNTSLFLVDSSDTTGRIFESLLNTSKLLKSTLLFESGEFEIYELYPLVYEDVNYSDKEK